MIKQLSIVNSADFLCPDQQNNTVSVCVFQPGRAVEHAGRASHAPGVSTLQEPAGICARVNCVCQLRTQVHR